MALTMALDDEFRARATYRAVLDAYGPVAPFDAIVQAEQRHIDALLPLFDKYAVPLPADRWTGRVTAPATLSQACEAGVAGEIRNYRMYDALLTGMVEPDVRSVFLNLRNASAYCHLPAFQSCAAREASTPQAHAFPSVPNSNVNSTIPTLWLGALLGFGLVWWFSRGQQPN
jgi:hypothetical protein